jgi:hypothetical protein
MMVVAIVGCSSSRECPSQLSHLKFMKGFSKLHIPITVNKSELEEFVNKKIPDTIYMDKNAGGQGVDLEVFKNGKPSLSMDGRTAFITLPMTINAKRDLGFISAKAKGSLFLTLKTIVEIESDWKWTTITSIEEINWVEEPKLKMAGMSISVKSMVNKFIKTSSSELTGELDRQLTDSQPLQKLMSDIQPYFERSYALDPEGKYFLQIIPQMAGLSSLIESEGAFNTQVVVEANATMLKDSGDFQKEVPQPTFEWADNKTSDYDLSAHISFPGEDIETLLVNEMRGLEFDLNNKRVKIKQIYFSLQNKKIKVETVLGGSIAGKVYFEGTPFWDSRKEEIRFCDQEVEIKVDRGISKALLWLSKSKIESVIAKKLEKGINDEIEKRIAEINTYLKDFNPSPLLSVKADIYGYSLNPILVRNRHLEVGININVRGNVNFDSLNFLMQ